MIYLGIDASTFTGVTAYDTIVDISQSRLFNFPKATGIHRAQLIARSVREMCDVYRPHVAAIEGMAFGNKNTLVTLTEISALVRAALLDARVPWYSVPPTVLKKWTTQSGNATKEVMAEHVKTRWGYAPSVKKGDDLVDSYALSRLCHALEGEESPDRQKLRKVVEFHCLPH